MKNMIRLLLPLMALLLLACSGTVNNSTKEIPNVKSQLSEELKAITETYSLDNHGFIYTVFKNDSAQIQVVHSGFIECLKMPKSQFGLAINLTFDESITGEKENHQRFRDSEHFSKFSTYKWSSIQCYALNLELDYKKAALMITDILISVYEFNESTNFSTDFYDQGPM